MSQNEPMPRSKGADLSDEELRSAIPRGKINRELQVGIFVILGLASLLASLFFLTDPSTFRGRYLATTSVLDAGGIRKGDPVQMKGVNIGRVQDFALGGEGVTITLELEGDWEIPVDSHTRLVSSGILGGKTVQVVPGDSPEILRAGGSLPGENMPGLLDFPPDLGRSAQDVLGRIQNLLDDPTIDAVQSSAGELRALLAHLTELTQTQGEEVARLTASLNRSAQGLEAAAGSGEDLARAVARADSALALANETTASLLKASNSLETILLRVEAGEGTLGLLATDRALYDNLTEATEGIRALVVDIRENPGRYVKVEIF